MLILGSLGQFAGDAILRLQLAPQRRGGPAARAAQRIRRKRGMAVRTAVQ